MKRTDWELIELCREDDQDAWTELYNRHAGCLYKIAIKVSRRKHGDTEDCLSHAHEAFIRCVRHFDPDRGVKFITLLWRAVENACRRCDPGGVIYIPCNAFRGEKTAQFAARATVQHSLDSSESSESLKMIDAFIDNADPASAMNYEEQRLIALRRLQRLPVRERDILRRRANGDTLQKIADHYGICKERVRQLEARSKERLSALEEIIP